MAEVAYAIGDPFWSKVAIGDEDACWLWTAGTNAKGYGRFHVPGTLSDAVLAHRYALEQKIGPLPKGVCSLHRCDNPPCCNPKHLFAGTRVDNNEDMRVKGRAAAPPLYKGETHPRSVLPDTQVAAIRDDPRTQTQIAEAFKVSQTTVWRIKNGLGRYA